MSDDILTQRRGRVLWITFNRPQARNAMKLTMYERLVELCTEINADDELRAVVLTGAGDKAFVAGTDISEFEAFKAPDDALNYEHKIGGVVDMLERVRIPLIAAIRGAVDAKPQGHDFHIGRGLAPATFDNVFIQHWIVGYGIVAVVTGHAEG